VKVHAKTKKIVISRDVFKEMIRLRDELDGLIETIEIMNDPGLIRGIKRGQADAKAGRVHELRSVTNLDEVWDANAD